VVLQLKKLGIDDLVSWQPQECTIHCSGAEDGCAIHSGCDKMCRQKSVMLFETCGLEFVLDICFLLFGVLIICGGGSMVSKYWFW
jgi:hypothetical protein